MPTIPRNEGVPRPQVKNDDLLTVAEATRVVPFSGRTLRRKAGTEIPCVRIGPRNLRFRREDLEAYLDSKLEGATK